jgi:transcriptional regulator with XRE-family HTH domain
MNFENMREWLARKLANNDDTEAMAVGPPLDVLRRDAEARAVTPSVLSSVPSEVGKVVRFVREQRGWTTNELADLADVEEVEIVRLETATDYQLSPRTVTNLANVCGFSIRRFQELANHVVVHAAHSSAGQSLRFAARSKNVSEVSQDELHTVSALVAVLSEKAQSR